jgi:hypothetical protein
MTIAKGATWDIDGDVGIAIGTSKKSAITISGTLIKSAGTGVSVVGVKLTDNGLVEAASGTLDMTQVLAGKGALKIDAGATLELGANVAKTVTFAGAGAILALGKAARFAATIVGFAAGNTIDLLKTAATGASVNANDQLVIVDGTKTVATLQLRGDYAGDTFNVTSDGHKGSDITVTLAEVPKLPAPGLFSQAMASLGREPGQAAGVSPSLGQSPHMRLFSPGSHR